MHGPWSMRDVAAGPPLEELERQIDGIKPGQMSRNGNAHTALELPGGTRVYVWDAAWRREIEHRLGLYLYLDARLFVRDHGGPEYDPFYWLEAVLPASEQLVDRFMARWRRDGQHDVVAAVTNIL